MPSSLAERAGLALTQPLLVDTPVESSGGVLNRVLALASFARQQDPSLPMNLRATRRVPEGSTPAEVPFRWVFTSDNRSRLPHGVAEDAHVVDFWDALDRVLPGFATAEKNRLAARALGKGRPLDVAVEEGYRKGDVELIPHQRSAEEGQHFYTSAIEVTDEAFLAHPDLASMAFLRSGKPDMQTGVGRLIGRYQAICATLSKPLEESTAADRDRLVNNIQALNAMQPEGTFEENHNHGWIAFALAQGGKGWTKFLLHQKGNDDALVSPYAPYSQISPLAMAVGVNDGMAVQELLNAGVSPNTVLREMPQMFAPAAQQKLNKAHASDFLPVAAFAALVGSAEAVGALLEHGADPNFANEKGNTPLHMACAEGQEFIARMLDRHQADFTLVNANNHAPDELIPANALHDSFHKWAAGRYEAQSRPAGVKVAATLSQRVQETAPAEDDPEALWLQPAARQVAARRSKSTP